MEVRRQVKTYMVDMMCPVCKEGIMRPEGRMVLMTNPPQYPHRCSDCGHVETYHKCYPQIEYKAKDWDEGG